MTNITIRPARADDYPAIARMLRQIAQLHHDWRPDVYRPAQKLDQKRFKSLLKDKNTPILVAEMDGGVIGYAMLRIITPQNPVQVPRNYLWVEDLCVDENARKQGVGKALMTAAAELARERGLSAIELNVWECNEVARAFYGRLGYTTQRRGLEMKL